MKRHWYGGLLAGLSATALLAACGPAAESTATTGAAPTATKAATQATATTASAGQTPVVDKIRPIPVVAAPAPNPQAQKGGTFRFLVSADPANFGIWDSAVGTTLGPAVPVHDSLLERNEYQAGKLDQILPNLAYDWWIDQPGTTWTFKLKEGVKFTDGQGFTCADVKFSLETIRDTRDSTGKAMVASPRADYIKRIKDITCSDNYTVQIKTDGPLPSLPATLALSTFDIQPKHIFQGNLNWEKSPGIGMGPYVFENYRPTEVINLKRNPGYWNQPFPHLDSVQFLNLGSATASESAFRVGRGEKTGLTRATQDQMVAQGKAFVSASTEGVSDGYYALHTNWQRPPFNDKRFALALRCAIDSRKIIDTALREGQGWEGPIFPLASDPNGSPWAITKDEWKASGPCHGPVSESDMVKRRQMAKDLMTQLGFGPNNPAKLRVEWWAGALESLWVPIFDDLKDLGVEVTYNLNQTPAYYSKASTGDFDLLPGGFETSRRDADHWLYEHYSSTSNRNYGKYVNAEVDVLIARQSKTLDPAERKKTLNQIEKMLLADNAKIVLLHRYIPHVFASWVQDEYWGRPANNQSTSAKLTRAWIDQAKMKQVTG